MLAAACVADTAALAQSTSKTKAAAEAKPLLDLNKATAKQLEETLPGVGVANAKKIVAGRPYAKVDDLAKAGVPARTIEALCPWSPWARPPPPRSSTPRRRP